MSATVDARAAAVGGPSAPLGRCRGVMALLVEAAP